MKKAVLLALILALACGMAPAVSAAGSEAVKAADTLNALGLFSGTGTDARGKPIYDLDRAPTRAEAVTMLVRLLGKENQAKAGTWTTPFTDVEEWAKPYVGYAYANKLTSGTGATTFGGSSAMTATQYLTLVLRALGYESGTDFQWDKAWELSDRIGMTDGEYATGNAVFFRGDVAAISVNSLGSKSKDSDVTLFHRLKDENAIPKDAVLEPASSKEELDPNQYYAYGDVGYISTFFHPKGFTLKNIKAATTEDGYCFKINYEAAASTKGDLFIMGKQPNDGKPDGYSVAFDSGKEVVYVRVSVEFLKNNPNLVLRIENPDGSYDDKNNIVEISSHFDTAVAPYRYIQYLDDTSTADGFTLYSLDIAESADGYCLRMKYKSTYARYVNFFVAGANDGTNEAFGFGLRQGEGYIYRTVSKTFIENNENLAMRVRNGNTYGEHNYIYIDTALGEVTQDLSKLPYEIKLDHVQTQNELQNVKLTDLAAAKTESGYAIRVKYDTDSLKRVFIFPAGLKDNADKIGRSAQISLGSDYAYIEIPNSFVENGNLLLMTAGGKSSELNRYYVYMAEGGAANLDYRPLKLQSLAGADAQLVLQGAGVAKTTDGYILRLNYESGFSRGTIVFPAGGGGQGQIYYAVLGSDSECQYIKIPAALFENNDMLVLKVEDKDGDFQNTAYIYTR